MTCWQEPPQSSPLSFEQPSFAYTQPPHTKVSASPLQHKQPPWHVWPLLPALFPPTQHIMPAPDPASPPTPSPSPPTHQDPDSYLLRMIGDQKLCDGFTLEIMGHDGIQDSILRPTLGY